MAALIDLPPLRALQAFEAVGRLGSVNEAATALGVSAGAISQQVRKLEDTLGLRLVERRGNGIALTSWGRHYLEGLTIGFDALRAAQDRLAKARLGGALVVSCLPSIAAKWLSHRLFDWQALHPGATVHLVGSEAEPALGRDGTDFRLTYGARVREHGDHVALFRDRVVPACAPTLLGGATLDDPAALLALPLLRIDWGMGHGALPDWADWARLAGTAPPRTTSALTFSLSSAAIDAAVAGRGVVLGQTSMISDDLASGRLVVPFDLRLDLPEAYGLAFDRGALEKPFGAQFRTWLVTESRRQQAAGQSGEHRPFGSEAVI